MPPTHCSPVAHTLVHEPQCWASSWSLKHDWPQANWPVGHRLTQLPAEHTWPAPHVVPHAPQFLPSVCVLTQVFPQRVVEPPQLQVPLKQPMAPGPHAWPQPPQLFTSKFVLTHAPLQLVKKPAHIAVHMPNWHAWPLAHATPQPPQFLTSVRVLTHVEPQSCWPKPGH